MHKKKYNFTFIDLFAGIGGFHLAFHNLGGQCVFASEMDIHARKTYEHNFKKISPELFANHNFNDDIRNIAPADIPDFDILCAGFPCQPFSQAGHKRGFEDNHHSERGNLFFNIVDILQEKKPKAFFLENVRGLVRHDDGNTFKIIQNILEKELGYSFYFKIVKASDYGLPQLRPRVFMIGFRDESFMKGFTFPAPIPLKFNMSEVWQGQCSREIGFTLRVGGRGSKIDDRRNWDAYLVDGQIRQLGIEQGKKMQGFPDNFEFPVSKTQGIKQLGNSVAIDAIQMVGEQLLNYLGKIVAPKALKKTKNKGEWSELLVFVKLLTEQKLFLSDKKLKATNSFFKIKKVSTQNLDLEFFVVDKSTVELKDKLSGASKTIQIQNILNPKVLELLTAAIRNGKGTFEIPAFDLIQKNLEFETVKGGTSFQKADIQLNIANEELSLENEGFGIKSYLGSKPTLLNASGNTNFIFELKGISLAEMEQINAISSRTKLKDRLLLIKKLGGILEFSGAEKKVMEGNLKRVDSLMPLIIGELLLCFYGKRISKLKDILTEIDQNSDLNTKINYGKKIDLNLKIKNLLVAILLGFFPGREWDGEYLANGTIVMKKTGDIVGFHISNMKELRHYLFENIRLDTPSSTRHRFGKVYKEKNGKLYFKLNLQLRF